LSIKWDSIVSKIGRLIRGSNGGVESCTVGIDRVGAAAERERREWRQKKLPIYNNPKLYNDFN
jgi:hypothetical protein